MYEEKELAETLFDKMIEVAGEKGYYERLYNETKKELDETKTKLQRIDLDYSMQLKTGEAINKALKDELEKLKDDKRESTEDTK